MKKPLFWFTLVELLIWLVFISIGLLSVISLMRSAITHTDRAKQDVLAINLAREGIEAVYVVRDTNRLRRSGKRDANWLCASPDIDSTANNCGIWLSSQPHWFLWHRRYVNGDVLPDFQTMASAPVLDLSDGLGSWESKRWIYYVSWSQGTEQQFSPNLRLWLNVTTPLSGFTNEGFYRSIVNKWLFQKDTNVTWWRAIASCITWTGTYTAISITWASIPNQSCGDSRPKEFRFCSRVEYWKQLKGKVELCGIITNYKE